MGADKRPVFFVETNGIQRKVAGAFFCLVKQSETVRNSAPCMEIDVEISLLGGATGWDLLGREGLNGPFG